MSDAIEREIDGQNWILKDHVENIVKGRLDTTREAHLKELEALKADLEASSKAKESLGQYEKELFSYRQDLALAYMGVDDQDEKQRKDLVKVLNWVYNDVFADVADKPPMDKWILQLKKNPEQIPALLKPHWPAKPVAPVAPQPAPSNQSAPETNAQAPATTSTRTAEDIGITPPDNLGTMNFEDLMRLVADGKLSYAQAVEKWKNQNQERFRKAGRGG